MPRTIRFHLDENCSRFIAEGLRRRGVDVTTTPEVGLLHSSDSLQIEYALNHKRVLFTQDRDFPSMHASGVEHAGIVYCATGSLSIGEMIRGLSLIWEIYDHDEILGMLEFL